MKPANEDMPIMHRIRDAFPDVQFAHYESDLYVLDPTREIKKWLKENFESYSICQSFIGAKGSDWEGCHCIDIPFNYIPFWERKIGGKRDA